MPEAFTSREVVALTRISARQLQWWDEQGIVVPARKGHRRVYSLEDIAEVAVVCELRQRGFSLQKIRRVLRFLQKELGERLVETVSAAAEYHLLTDGRHIYLEDSARGVVDLLKNARQPMLTVCLSDTIHGLFSPPKRQPKNVRQPSRDSSQGQPFCADFRSSAIRGGLVRHLTLRGNRAS